ncbi:hypothetical protein predicted by Glimmer/Critica [Helicobacter pylori B8]|uniref:Uncharacterized protein n=1 Tax=Helicobacter pylori (strain B8) TaxID=693745 RepID=D7FCG7_HELP3|nr:hypothetical protein predicted by Glimmer/Critica [Helicobacter pylori B8]
MFFKSSLKAFSFKGFPLKLILNLWGYKNSFKLALIFFF